MLWSGKRAKAESEDDLVYGLVYELRQQRMMAQSDTQYWFLYNVVAEELAKKQLMKQFSSQPSPNFRKLNDGMKAAALEEGDNFTVTDALTEIAFPVPKGGLINQESEYGFDDMKDQSIF